MNELSLNDWARPCITRTNDLNDRTFSDGATAIFRCVLYSLCYTVYFMLYRNSLT